MVFIRARPQNKKKVILFINKAHKKIIDLLIPWFGDTTGDVMMNLSLRWIEQNIANENIAALGRALHTLSEPPQPPRPTERLEAKQKPKNVRKKPKKVAPKVATVGQMEQAKQRYRKK